MAEKATAALPIGPEEFREILEEFKDDPHVQDLIRKIGEEQGVGLLGPAGSAVPVIPPLSSAFATPVILTAEEAREAADDSLEAAFKSREAADMVAQAVTNLNTNPCGEQPAEEVVPIRDHQDNKIAAINQAFELLQGRIKTLEERMASLEAEEDRQIMEEFA